MYGDDHLHRYNTSQRVTRLSLTIPHLTRNHKSQKSSYFYYIQLIGGETNSQTLITSCGFSAGALASDSTLLGLRGNFISDCQLVFHRRPFIFFLPLPQMSSFTCHLYHSLKFFLKLIFKNTWIYLFQKMSLYCCLKWTTGITR